MAGRPVRASRWLGGQLSVYPMTSRNAEYCVDSVNGSDNNTGKDWDNAKATIAAAYALCTANMGDHIWLAPGHYEDLADAQIDLATAGVTIAGVPDAVDSDMPRIDFNHANASVNLGADNIILRNIAFRPGITDVLIGVDIEAGSTGCVVEDCYFMQGEDGAGVDDFILPINLKAGCHDTIIRRNRIRSHAAAAGYTDGIDLIGVSCRVIIEDNLIQGNFSVSGVGNSAGVCDVILVKDNIIKVADGQPGIELVATTNGILTGNQIESTGIAPDSAIVAADCSWFGNYVVVADGTAAELIGTVTETVQPIGSIFVIEKRINHNTIVAAGVDLTGVSTGEVMLMETLLINEGTAMDSGADGADLDLISNNAEGGIVIGTIDDDGVAADTNYSGASGNWTTYQQNYPLEAGKKIRSRAGDEDFTSNDFITFRMTFMRMTAGATIAAA